MGNDEVEEMQLSKKLLKSAIGAEIKSVELRYKCGEPVALSESNPNVQKIGTVKLLFPKPTSGDNKQ